MSLVFDYVCSFAAIQRRSPLRPDKRGNGRHDSGKNALRRRQAALPVLDTGNVYRLVSQALLIDIDACPVFFATLY